jgi:2-methylcitrate dehydratase PrpD
LRFDASARLAVASAQRSLLDLIGRCRRGQPDAVRRHRERVRGDAAWRQRSQRAHPVRRSPRRTRGRGFRGATTIDALDAHDGHVLTKGHAGVALLPALARADRRRASGRAGPTSTGASSSSAWCLATKIATRAGIALHATGADYHCSGAWNSLGCAAIAARFSSSMPSAHATRSESPSTSAARADPARMRFPTMVKDGSGWGAHVGVSAALLARDGFHWSAGIDDRAGRRRTVLGDLGTRWRISEQYFKAYPVCRWAQPAIEAVLGLKQRARLRGERSRANRDRELSRGGGAGARSARCHTYTEEAQYSLAFPVAAALVFGDVGANEVDTIGLKDAARRAPGCRDHGSRRCRILRSIPARALCTRAHHVE